MVETPKAPNKFTYCYDCIVVYPLQKLSLKKREQCRNWGKDIPGKEMKISKKQKDIPQHVRSQSH